MSRRTLLRGETAAGSVHISSLVVHCQPQAVPATVERISAMPNVEVPQYSDQGKLVVLLETANEGIIMERISAIENLAGVINVALVYHHFDTETGITS
jgi:nitrate reductase NapD